MPGADPSSHTDIDHFVRLAQAAERGKIQLVFFADTPTLSVDLEDHTPQFPIDPLLVFTAIARETERIGLVSTGSTTFNEPYNLARQFKALDVISHGRAGWNAVTTSDPTAAANYGREISPRAEKYERAHEVIQIVQSLWGSWEKDAWVRDVRGNRPHCRSARRNCSRAARRSSGSPTRTRRSVSGCALWRTASAPSADSPSPCSPPSG
ncbi:LLM class flavin-dependent oxidoreductase [Streptomyces sp. NPDC056305]|uniref:LLM class flavin-dependent oxidoreductase n=1 Tax=unclassified Streptomyces TaxID=2593676 RepID=UPI0035DBAE57